MPPYLIILGAVGLAAWVIKELAEWGDEREIRKERVIQWKRETLDDEILFKKRKLAKDYVKAKIKLAKQERKSIYDSLHTLKGQRKIVRDRLRELKNGPERRKIGRALSEFDDVVDEKYAEAYRYTAFIDEAYRIVERMYEDNSSPSKRRIKAAQRLEMEGFFANSDVPVKGRVVLGVVRSPKRGPWFELDCSMRGMLSERERGMYQSNYAKGDKVKLFVEEAQYREGTATVSVRKAKFLERWNDGKKIWGGEVTGGNKGGMLVDIGVVTAFVPRSMVEISWRLGSEVKVEIIEVDQKLRKIIGKPETQKKVKD